MDRERAGFAFVFGSRFWVWLLGGAAGKLPRLLLTQLGMEKEGCREVKQEN